MRLQCVNLGRLFRCPDCIKDSKFVKKLKLFHRTFVYNEFTNGIVIADTALNPMFWFVDTFGYYAGFILVILVWVLVFNMIFIFYFCIVGQLLQTSYINLIVQLIFGHWLAVNTVFHYYMGWRTNPGKPPDTKFDNVVSVCKKCLSPKPARTHHCSICKRCVLKMDHHCPWFNNCIGHYNHRYFFMFTVFMIIDCVYLTTIGFYYYQLHAYPNMNLRVYHLFLHQIIPNVDDSMLGSTFFHKMATLEFFIAFVAIWALMLLAGLNAFLISKGATNIEIKSLQVNPFKPDFFEHPYNLGFKTNWKVFLGFDDFRSFFFKVVLPSPHKPLGDGVSWKEYTDLYEKLRTKANATTSNEFLV